jgi:hypothetical protein
MHAWMFYDGVEPVYLELITRPPSRHQCTRARSNRVQRLPSWFFQFQEQRLKNIKCSMRFQTQSRFKELEKDLPLHGLSSLYSQQLHQYLHLVLKWFMIKYRHSNLFTQVPPPIRREPVRRLPPTGLQSVLPSSNWSEAASSYVWVIKMRNNR